MLTVVVLLTSIAASPGVYGDGRDDQTLLFQRLVNRNLPEQLEGYRIGGDLAPFSLAADVLIDSQLPLTGDGLAPWHGFFFIDAFAALKVVESVDLNLNLFILNRTASGGFRLQSGVVPGFAGHFHPTLGIIDGHPLLFDVLAVDLDVVTLGQGLLLETVPLEGFRVGFRWNGLELQSTFGGRVFWPEDDLLHFALTALDGRVGVGVTHWFSGFTEGYGSDGTYAQVFGKWPLLPGLTASAEYAARLGGPANLAHGLLGRADFLERWSNLSLHVGYQFRWYQQHYGPFDRLLTPSNVPTVPIRENYYVTNSYEYLWLTPLYDQWSHTAMFEARYFFGPFEVFVELEAFVRFFADREQAPPRVVTTLDQELLPNVLTKLYGSGGLRLYPLEGLPHRFAAYVTNKSVANDVELLGPSARRFLDLPLFLVEAELRL